MGESASECRKSDALTARIMQARMNHCPDFQSSTCGWLTQVWGKSSKTHLGIRISWISVVQMMIVLLNAWFPSFESLSDRANPGSLAFTMFSSCSSIRPLGPKSGKFLEDFTHLYPSNIVPTCKTVCLFVTKVHHCSQHCGWRVEESLYPSEVLQPSRWIWKVLQSSPSSPP